MGELISSVSTPWVNFQLSDSKSLELKIMLFLELSARRQITRWIKIKRRVAKEFIKIL
jgi:hypothetical protein